MQYVSVFHKGPYIKSNKTSRPRLKGAVSRNSAKSGYYKMPVKLKET